jgi:hypothetical protein
MGQIARDGIFVERTGEKGSRFSEEAEPLCGGFRFASGGMFGDERMLGLFSASPVRQVRAARRWEGAKRSRLDHA